MGNKYLPPEDLVGKLGSKKDLYDILGVDCKGSRFNPLYSRLLLTTLWEMFNRVYERNSCRKKESKFKIINQPSPIRHCNQIKLQWFQFQGTKSWASSLFGILWKRLKTLFNISQFMKKALFQKDHFYGEFSALWEKMHERLY